MRALAVSQVRAGVARDGHRPARAAPWNREPAAALAAPVTERLLEAPPWVTLNLNVPVVATGATPRRGGPGSAPSARCVLAVNRPRGRAPAVRAAWPSDEELRADTDTALLRKGMATVTALGGIAEVVGDPPHGPADAADADAGPVGGPPGADRRGPRRAR